MKIRNIYVAGAVVGLCILSASCIDQIKFGSSFLEKAPGGTVTKDTVFSNPEYARQFLNRIYGLQYYGLPYGNSSAFPWKKDPWSGCEQAITDCWNNQWTGTGIISQYYKGGLTASYGNRQIIFDYDRSNVWEAVRYCYLLMNNISSVPNMEQSEKDQMVAEAKCLLAVRYFDLLRYYGGVPIIDKDFSGTDASYELPRGTVEETVNFIVKNLDEAIAVLPWTNSDPTNNFGHWTKAGAMALKCKVLLLAASPIFNADQPYSTNTSATQEQQLSWWYGNYSVDRWKRCLTACEEFFNALNANGGYSLVQATAGVSGKGIRPEDYRLAFRKAYYTQESSEILHSVRVMTGGDAFKSGSYVWHQYGAYDNQQSSKLQVGSGRTCTPTAEYVEMFPWKDGKPFDYNSLDNVGRDTMFTTGTGKTGVSLTRDPRLYESCIVNGMPKSLSWSNGTMSGDPWELWVGGSDENNNSKNENNSFATGFANNKYYIGFDGIRKPTQWVTLRLSEMYLIYAEALLEANNDFTGALQQVDKVRARVGLKGLAECNPSENLTSNKENLLNEIIRERVCELGFEGTRWFDLMRWKLGDKFLTKHLHGLRTYRLDANGQHVTSKWRDNTGSDGHTKVEQPTKFDYERFELTNTRVWWGTTFDPKWYLCPFPQSEINKGYGCIQNPGW